jgi:hypothetical protein
MKQEEKLRSAAAEENYRSHLEDILAIIML